MDTSLKQAEISGLLDFARRFYQIGIDHVHYIEFQASFPSLCDYVIEHAFTMFVTNRSYWLTPEHFIHNYHNTFLTTQDWCNHAQMLRSITIGA